MKASELGWKEHFLSALPDSDTMLRWRRLSRPQEDRCGKLLIESVDERGCPQGSALAIPADAEVEPLVLVSEQEKADAELLGELLPFVQLRAGIVHIDIENAPPAHPHARSRQQKWQQAYKAIAARIAEAKEEKS